MIAWGINSLNHGSSIAVIKPDGLASFEVYNEDRLSTSAFTHALNRGTPDVIYWYERPWIKKARQLTAKQWKTAADLSVVPRRWINSHGFKWAPLKYTPHHASHAAAGYYTSPFNHCAIVVLDAIGEFECATIWEGKHGELHKVWSRSYPHSLGLFYSAFTKLCGLEPIKQEYLLQQMAENGRADRYYHDVKEYMGSIVNAHKNMHRGINDWPYAINSLQDQCDIAASVQDVFTEQVDMVMRKAKELTGADCLVYMGGCAMNSLANKQVVEPKFKYRWSLPMPGDPSSAIGSVVYHTKQRIWNYRWSPVKHLEINI